MTSSYDQQGSELPVSAILNGLDLGLVLALTIAAASASLLVLPVPTAIASTMLAALMICGGVADAKAYVLPNLVTYAAILTGIAVAYALHPDAPGTKASIAALRGLGSVLALLSLRRCYASLRGREGLGLGDVKLAGAIGVWLPLDEIPMCFALASFLALFAVLISRWRGQTTTRTTKIPFGVYLCPALWLTFFANAVCS
jgi:leader peptidase (prepilin peptidase) / N-methyltransferase